MDGLKTSLLLALAVGGWARPALSGDRPAPGPIERSMTASVDDHVARGWADSGAGPSPRSSDAEFLRRASLDLTGKIPAVAEVRAFLDDTGLEKRREFVDRALRGPSATTHFVNTWRPLLAPAVAVGNGRLLTPEFDAWLGAKFADGDGFDRIVRDLLTYPLADAPASALAFRPQGGPPSPLAFYSSREFKPEELASGTARLFLGVRIECAQCHDHPFAAWKRDQFWEFAANFAGLGVQGPANAFNAKVVERKGRSELPIPGTGRKAQARFLDGSWDASEQGGGRGSVASWVTSPANPYFARAIVNRGWAQLFGVGLVDPVDDFSDSNPPSHPELLDDLARRFAESGFDWPLLLRALAASRPYQLSSSGPEEGFDDARRFARMAVKGMSAEQWYDSLTRAFGLAVEVANPNARVVAPTGPRAAFLEKFASKDERAIDRPTSILQALALMHGPLVIEGTDPQRGATLGAVLEAPFLDTRGRIEVLYLAALSRPPRPDELERMVAYVEARDPKVALADLFWAILNGAEFALNH